MDERMESAAARAERRRNEQKQEEERRQAVAAAARLVEVVGEWRKVIGHSILILGSNGAPVEVVVKRVSDNGYLCLHVTGNTAADNPGIWVAIANVQMLDNLVEATPLGLSQFAVLSVTGFSDAAMAELAEMNRQADPAPRPLGASEDATVTQKPAQKRTSRKAKTEEPAALGN